MYDQNLTSAELFAFRNDPVTFARKLDPGTFFSDEEITSALYVQAELGGDLGAMPWAAAVGIRVVRTEETLGGNVAQDLNGRRHFDLYARRVGQQQYSVASDSS